MPEDETIHTDARPGKWVPGIGWVALLNELPVGTKCKISKDGTAADVVADHVGRYAKVVVIVVEWPDGTKPMGEPTGGNDD